MKLLKVYELVIWTRIQRWKLERVLKTLFRSRPTAYFVIEHRNSKGELLYKNASALINQGEKYILESFFQGNNTPTAFKMDLATDASVAEGATTYTAVTGTGSGAKSLVRNNTDFPSELSGDDWRVSSRAAATVWTNSGVAAWDTANCAVLMATIAAADKLIAYTTLAIPRQLQIGDVLTGQIVVSMA